MIKRFLACTVVVCACGKPDALNQPIDATPPVADAGFVGVIDSGLVDVGLGSDVVIADVGGTPDVAIRDAERRDQQPQDAVVADAGFEDSGTLDTGSLDAGRDGGPPDAAVDAGVSFGCGAYPRTCRDREQWMPGLDEHFMLATSGCSFGLTPPSDADWRQGRAGLKSCAHGRNGESRHVAARLNRQGRPSITNRNAAVTQPPVAGLDLERGR